MKMPFNVDEAIDNAISVIKNLEDFYGTYTGQQLAYMKIEDSFFINVRDGLVTQEYNNEGHNSRAYQPDINLPEYNPTGDHTFTSILCNIKHCHLTEAEMREKIDLFLYNIPIAGR